MKNRKEKKGKERKKDRQTDQYLASTERNVYMYIYIYIYV